MTDRTCSFGASEGGAMNRGERAGGRVRNTQVAVLSDAGHYEQVFGTATQPTRRRGVVAGDDEGVRRAPGVSVRMVKARPHRPTIRRRRLVRPLVSRFVRGMVDQSPPTSAKPSHDGSCPQLGTLRAPPHRYCAQRHAHETSGTILRDLWLDPSTSGGT